MVSLLKKVIVRYKIVDMYINNGSVYRFLVFKSEILDIYKNTVIELINVFFFVNIFYVWKNKV